jgi:hypothetical protein
MLATAQGSPQTPAQSTDAKPSVRVTGRALRDEAGRDHAAIEKTAPFFFDVGADGSKVGEVLGKLRRLAGMPGCAEAEVEGGGPEATWSSSAPLLPEFSLWLLRVSDVAPPS